MRPILVGLMLFVTACCKKQPPPPSVSAPASAASASGPSSIASQAPSTSSAPVAPVATAPAVEEVPAEYAMAADLYLPETGKVLPLPKYEAAAKETFKAHAAALQKAYELAVTSGDKEEARFSVSHVPATYVIFSHKGKPNSQPSYLPSDATPEFWSMLRVVGDSDKTFVIGSIGGDGKFPDSGMAAPYALMQTSRGLYFDLLGDGALTFVLRRIGALPDDPRGQIVDCVGQTWGGSANLSTGALVEVPDYPGRARDIDGDGKPDFPARRFSFVVPGHAHTIPPNVDGACNLAVSAFTIDVVGVTSFVTGWSEASAPVAVAYERLQSMARARAAKLRTQLGKPLLRKAGQLVLHDECAPDAAQTAAALYVYARTLGASEASALAEADAAMKGFQLDPSHCGGLVRTTSTAPTGDRWPDLRAALIAAKIGVVRADTHADAGLDGG